MAMLFGSQDSGIQCCFNQLRGCLSYVVVYTNRAGHQIGYQWVTAQGFFVIYELPSKACFSCQLPQMNAVYHWATTVSSKPCPKNNFRMWIVLVGFDKGRRSVAQIVRRLWEHRTPVRSVLISKKIDFREIFIFRVSVWYETFMDTVWFAHLWWPVSPIVRTVARPFAHPS